MIFTRNFLITLSTLIIALNLNNAERTKDFMYENIAGSKACFRRLNATHQVGCSSKRGGSTGAIHYCETQADFDYILRNGTGGPYIPVMPTALFTPPNLNRMRHSDKISGLLLFADGIGAKDYFSHDNQCPNPRSSLAGTCGQGRPVWNQFGSGILFQDVPFPIFYVEDKENVGTIRECFDKHNNYSFDTQKDRSLCALQLQAFMYATTDTPTCVRRSNSVTNLNPIHFCDPLADQNIWASLYPLAKPSTNFKEPKKSRYIIIAARLDTTSLFEKTAGAVSPITGLVTLLSTAQILQKSREDGVEDKNILYLLLNGESYDYIGSQRLIYDMSNGDFPVKKHDHQILPAINLGDIDLFIELSQLSNSNHVVGHYKDNGVVEKFLERLQQISGDLKVELSKNSLPPASLHSFLRNNSEFPGLILADHQNHYVNHFYNSVYDNATNIDYEYMNNSYSIRASVKGTIQEHIGKVSLTVAKAVYEQYTGKPFTGAYRYDIQLIDELLHCYLEDANCKVHQAVQKQKLQQTPFNLYVGVGVSPNFITTLIGLTLGWLTGDIVGEGNINCTKSHGDEAIKYFNMSASLDDLNTTLCYRVSMNFTEALSPAFLIKDYDWSSGQYSTWSESTWNDIKIRMFLKPSKAHENMTIAIGSIVLILSFVFVYFVKSRSDVLFVPGLPTLAPTNC